MRNGLKRGICVVLAAVFAVSAVYFGMMFWRTKQEYRQGDEDLELIREIRAEAQEPLAEEPEEAEDRTVDEASRRAAQENARREKKAGYERLKVQNQDMIGWIRIDGTVIDYPVMQTPEEPDYYLRRGFDERYSVYGMIYMDASCRLEDSCANYILYGHHMKNGTMFASLEEYISEAYWKEHPELEFDTLEEEGTYEILGAFKLPVSQMNVDFAYKLAAGTKEDYNQFLDYIKENAFYDTGVTAQWPEQLVTLTTCEYTQRDGRFFLVAKKKQTHEFR